MSNNTLLIDCEGQVRGCGDNHYDQLIESDDVEIPSFITLEELPPIVSLASGLTHNIFLDRRGRAYGLGNWTSGQLGDGLRDSSRLNLPRPVHSVACGQSHSLFLDNHGEVWGCGSNSNQQLAQPNQGQINWPTNLKLFNIVAIAAGRYSSLFLSSEGQVERCGLHLWDDTSLVHLGGLPLVKALACGGIDQAALISLNGDVWTYVDDKLIKVTSIESARTVACGDHHTLCLDEQGRAWSWGLNNLDQLGHSKFFGLVQLPQITAISAGANHSIFIDSQGIVWGCGDNSYHQLSSSSRNRIKLSQLPV
jgi:alpha-tubulin suppressor-like RCC1 family protein